MHISLVAAMSKNGVIGNNNALPWHLPEELKYFRKVTLGKPVIMGRKTFGSIGKPLPNRRNIIMTHSTVPIPGCWVAGSIQEALALVQDYEEVMVIGGAKIYESFLPFASRIYLTIIHQQYEGDTYFPEVNWRQWEQVSEQIMDGFTAKVFNKRNDTLDSNAKGIN